jgi:hypothetical protein
MGGSDFNEQRIQYVINFTIALGLDEILSEAKIRVDVSQALLRCIRSIQFMAESYLDNLPPAPYTETADVEAFYAKSARLKEVLNPQLSGVKRKPLGNRPTRKLRRR